MLTSNSIPFQHVLITFIFVAGGRAEVGLVYPERAQNGAFCISVSFVSWNFMLHPRDKVTKSKIQVGTEEIIFFIQPLRKPRKGAKHAAKLPLFIQVTVLFLINFQICYLTIKLPGFL